MIVVTWEEFIVREPRASLSSDSVLRVTAKGESKLHARYGVSYSQQGRRTAQTGGNPPTDSPTSGTAH